MKYYNYFSNFITKDRDSTSIYDFRKSLLFIVSRAFCEDIVSVHLLNHAENLLLSYDKVKLAKIIPRKNVYDNALKVFRSIVKTKKYKKALIKLAQTMDFGLSSKEIKEKLEVVIEILTKIQPVLLDNINVNGIISTQMNFYVNSEIGVLLSNVTNSKNAILCQDEALQCALIRLFCHETTHIVIRFLHSLSKYDFLKGTPKKSNIVDNKIGDYEGGYRFEEILFGSCRRVIYDSNKFVQKLLDKETWENEDLPIFKECELSEMDQITKNYFFSGIDNNDDLQFYE